MQRFLLDNSNIIIIIINYTKKCAIQYNELSTAINLCPVLNIYTLRNNSKMDTILYIFFHFVRHFVSYVFPVLFF